MTRVAPARKKRLFPVLLAAVLVALAACRAIRGMGRTMSDLLHLQSELAAAFNDPNISVNATNSVLTIVFVNSSLQSDSTAKRVELARRVAEYVRDHYAEYPELTRVSVGFQSRVEVGGFTAQQTSVPYTFTTEQLGPGVQHSTADSGARAGGQTTQ